MKPPGSPPRPLRRAQTSAGPRSTSATSCACSQSGDSASRQRWPSELSELRPAVGGGWSARSRAERRGHRLSELRRPGEFGNRTARTGRLARGPRRGAGRRADPGGSSGHLLRRDHPRRRHGRDRREGAVVITEPKPTTNEITVTVNGAEHSLEVEPRLLLVHFLREKLGLTGPHVGCDTTSCGACTVLVDGVPIKSCTHFAVQVNGKAVQTVEGLTQGGQLHPIQEGFREEHGLQCGFCTPGMMLVTSALLEENPSPTEEEIRWAISGNICRCTGYQNIVKAVQWAANKMEEPS